MKTPSLKYRRTDFAEDFFYYCPMILRGIYLFDSFKVDRELFTQAVKATLHRHPNLNCNIFSSLNHLYWKEVDSEFTNLSFREMKHSNEWEQISEEMTFKEYPIDVNEHRWRVHVFEHPEQTVLVVESCHSLCDVGSLNILLDSIMSYYSAFFGGKKYDPKEEVFKQQSFSIPMNSALYPKGFSSEQIERMKEYSKQSEEEFSKFKLRAPINKIDYTPSMKGVNLSYREGEPENLIALTAFLKGKQLSIHPFFVAASLVALSSIAEEQESDPVKKLSFGITRNLRKVIGPEFRNSIGIYSDTQALMNYQIDEELTLLEYAFSLRDKLEKERETYNYQFFMLSQKELNKEMFKSSPDNHFSDCYFTNNGRYEHSTEYSLDSNSQSQKVSLRNYFYTHNNVGDSHTPFYVYFSTYKKMTFSIVGLKDPKNKDIAEKFVSRAIQVIENGPLYSGMRIKEIIKTVNVITN